MTEIWYSTLLSEKTYNYLCASLKGLISTKSGAYFSSSKLPNLKGLGKEFQLRLRDGQRNENRIVFFKQAINRRRVTMITGHERYMEWEAM